MFALGTFLSVNAQEVIYSEDFNDSSVSNPPVGWVFEDMDGDGYNFGDMYFVPDANENPVSPISLISRSWQGSALFPDNTATSPLIDLESASGDITLEWKVTAASNPLWNSEHYSVYVSTLTDVYEVVLEDAAFSETYAGTGNQLTRTVDISSFAGQKVFVTFRHHNVTDMDYLSIDDVKVTAASLAVSNVTTSKVSLYPNPVSDSFELKLAQNYDASKVKVTISDLTGRKVKSFSNANSYNVSDLNSGVYVVTVSDGAHTFTQKLIKK